MINGVIFDMDGLMFDTERMWATFWEPALAALGLEYKEGLAEAERGTAGETSRNIVRQFYGEDCDANAIIDSLHRVAEALLERETLSGDEVKRLMRGEELPPLDLKANPRKLTTRPSTRKKGGKKESGHSAGSGEDAKGADTPPAGEPGPDSDGDARKQGAVQTDEAGLYKRRSPLGAALTRPRTNGGETAEEKTGETDDSDAPAPVKNDKES